MEAFVQMFTLENLGYLGIGALLSLGIAAGALVIGTLIGTLGAMGKISRHRLPRFIATAYVEIIRGTPMMLQILFLVLALPMAYLAITGQRIRPDPMLLGTIAMGINSGAYITELIRSGIEGVDRGQMEAARTLGLSHGKAMRHVILPQAFKRVVPPLVSEFIVLIKDSSLLYAVGVLELLMRAKTMGAKHFNYVVPLLMVSCMYLIMTMTVSFFARRLERRLKVSD